MKKTLLYILSIPFLLIAIITSITCLVDPNNGTLTLSIISWGFFIVIIYKGKKSGNSKNSHITIETSYIHNGENESSLEGMKAQKILKIIDTSSLNSKPWHKDPVSKKQKDLLEDFEVKNISNLTKGEASLIISAIFDENNNPQQGSSSHPNPEDQKNSINWANKVLSDKNKYVILDTETTGLGKKDEVIQIGIIDMDGKTLLTQNIKPTHHTSIPKEASQVHGLTMKDLKKCPTFDQLEEKLETVLNGKVIIAYNSKFDKRLCIQTQKICGGYQIKNKWSCAMLEYAKFIGELNSSKGNYKWHKLEGGDHSATGDCIATLNVIKKMAGQIQ